MGTLVFIRLLCTKSATGLLDVEGSFWVKSRGSFSSFLQQNNLGSTLCTLTLFGAHGKRGFLTHPNPFTVTDYHIAQLHALHTRSLLAANKTASLFTRCGYPYPKGAWKISHPLHGLTLRDEMDATKLRGKIALYNFSDIPIHDSEIFESKVSSRTDFLSGAHYLCDYFFSV
ncbi:hypothetical protein BCR34DRAFT_387681 [Clohesyomyces aquaticus]|uniref:Uncharacterized protein n=1 Tax=Clohesyomyces aquaticus TaxID=1231657 RepID=A0A1Y1ZF21_9PLEO|nr:hypothetical protein BCR34DRAFT_387681 [Clohesyomyces aquaticus]